jgi:hypothetical protein
MPSIDVFALFGKKPLCRYIESDYSTWRIHEKTTRVTKRVFEKSPKM